MLLAGIIRLHLLLLLVMVLVLLGGVWLLCLSKLLFLIPDVGWLLRNSLRWSGIDVLAVLLLLLLMISLHVSLDLGQLGWLDGLFGQIAGRHLVVFEGIIAWSLSYIILALMRSGSRLMRQLLLLMLLL